MFFFSIALRPVVLQVLCYMYQKIDVRLSIGYQHSCRFVRIKPECICLTFQTASTCKKMPFVRHIAIRAIATQTTSTWWRTASRRAQGVTSQVRHARGLVTEWATRMTVQVTVRVMIIVGLTYLWRQVKTHVTCRAYVRLFIFLLIKQTIHISHL